MAATVSATAYVRLKPFNVKKGNKLRRFLVFGYKFLEERGWYKIPRKTDHQKMPATAVSPPVFEEVDVIEYLREVHNDNEDPDSPLAFDIVDTLKEAQEIDKREAKAKAAKEKRPGAEAAADLTAGRRAVGESAKKRAPVGRAKANEEDAEDESE